MMPLKLRRSALYLLLFVLIVPILAACAGTGAPQPIRETVIVQAPTAPPVKETVIVQAPTAEPGATGPTAAAAPGAFTQLHPALGDVKVRQAIAYCTNRPELIKSVYPFLSEEEQKKLLMDTNLPQGHWALSAEGITTYPFDAAKGNALLEEAGWTLPEGAQPNEATRAKEGAPIFLRFTTTDAQFRQTWASVFEQQLKDNCGIKIARTHAPASWWFGDTTGLARRDYELGAFAWVGEPDPGGTTLYACNQIPLPSNNWEGQNGMGWCNETASKAIVAANSTLDREQRKKQYAIFLQEFTKDMVSLPLFNRLEAQAWSKSLKNFKNDSTEYMTANAGEWELEGGDSVVIGFSQEPASLFTLVEDAAVARQAAQLISLIPVTTYNYDYQAYALKQLPDVSKGGATLTEVDVKEGDKVWTVGQEVADLKAGVEVLNSAGEVVKFETGTIKMNQLTVTFDYVDGLKWEDGQPITKADFELGLKIDCDPDSGATSFSVCESRAKVDFESDTKHTVTYLPGAVWPEYQTYVISAYPAHQVIESEGPNKGKKLAEVPAKDWVTLHEIAEDPLSSGPYKLVEWVKGQKMVFEANENFFKGTPKVKTVTIQIIEDTNQAVAQLLTGDIDIVEKATLGAGPEVETVLNAAKEGKINAEAVASPTWEHVDMNLYAK